jgi:hypothetical protein
MSAVVIGPIDQQEIKPIYFVFSDEVSGVNISSATVTASVVSGTDASPAGILTGIISIDNATKIVSQKVAPVGRTGNTYKLRCAATDANGNVHVVAAQLAVVSL